MNDTNIVAPAWYESTEGPQISLTLKYIAAQLLPIIHDVSGVTIVSQQADRLIDAGLIVFFSLAALYAHIRAKRNLGAQISRLKKENDNFAEAFAAQKTSAKQA